MKSVDLWQNFCASLLYLEYMYDMVVKKFTFALSSAMSFLVLITNRIWLSIGTDSGNLE